MGRTWGDKPYEPVDMLAIYQGAAKGGQEKEFDHFFSFSGHFWSLFLMLLSLFSSLFAKLLLPDSFFWQGEQNYTGRREEKLQNSIWTRFWMGPNCGGAWALVDSEYELFSESSQKSIDVIILKQTKQVNQQNLISPTRRKTAWKQFWFKYLKLERNADHLGCDFWEGGGGGAETPETHSREKFAGKTRWEISGQFSSSSQTKKKSSQIRSAELWDQKCYSCHGLSRGKNSVFGQFSPLPTPISQPPIQNPIFFLWSARRLWHCHSNCDRVGQPQTRKTLRSRKKRRT